MEQVVNEFVLKLLQIVLSVFILGILCAIFYKKIIGKAGEFHVKNELKKLPKDK